MIGQIRSVLIVMGLLLSGGLLHAGEVGAKADLAVAEVLFDYDAASEFATWRVGDDGMVEIVFAQNMPDGLYAELLNKLQNHPDIPDVLAGRGGPPCSLW
jgi:hypothetical protein